MGVLARESWEISSIERLFLYDAFIDMLSEGAAENAIELLEEIPPDVTYAEMLKPYLGDDWLDSFYKEINPFNLHASKIVGILKRIRQRQSSKSTEALRKSYEGCLQIFTGIISAVKELAEESGSEEGLKAVFEIEAFCTLADAYIGSHADEVVC